MAIDPEDLLACVDAMNPAQRARLAALLPREPGGYLGPEGEVRLAATGPRGVPGPQGPQRPRDDDPRDRDKDRGAQHGASNRDIVARARSMWEKPSAESVARMLKGRAGEAAGPDNPPGPPWPVPLANVTIMPADAAVGMMAAECQISGGCGPVDMACLFGPGSEGLDVKGEFVIQLADVVAPTPLFRAFLARYGDVCNAKDNHLRLYCKQGDLELLHCVVTSIGPAAVAGSLQVSSATLMACRIRRPAGRQPGKGTAVAAVGGFELEPAEFVPGPPFVVAAFDEETRKEILKNGHQDLGKHASWIVSEAVQPYTVIPPPAAAEADPMDWDNLGRFADKHGCKELLDRWGRVDDRWRKIFGEDGVPRVRTPGRSLVDLERVEAMLYDKEVKGIEPPRCCCGCGNVIGCGVP